MKAHPPRDPADDGAEIIVLRNKPEEFYQSVIAMAAYRRNAETTHILRVENAFCKKVGAPCWC
jgi:hypothetical protein